MKIHPSSRATRSISGLTLLEMVVVIAILAAVTTLAIRSTSGLINETRSDATGQTLSAFRNAVLGQPASVGSGAAPQLSSFASDLGRLPRTVLDGTGTKLTLSEFFKANGSPNYTVYTIAESNTVLVWDSSVQGATALNKGISSNVLQFACGWRGPYLYAPPNQDSLLDGWGKRIEPLVGTTNSSIQFWQYVTNSGLPTPNFSVATVSRAEVAGIAVSPGAGTSLNSEDDPYTQTLYSTVNLNEVSATVVVQLNVTGLTGSAANLPPKNNLYVDFRVFGPNPAADVNPTVPIRCVLKRVKYDSPVISATMTVPFLIGPKVVIAEVVGSNGSKPTTVIGSFSNILSPSTTFFQSGINFVQVGIAVN